MATTISIETRRQLEDILGEIVANKPELRSALEQDPRGTLESIGLTDLPEDLEIRVISESAPEMTLVLPDVSASDELSDSDLDAVAGGVGVLSAGPNVPTFGAARTQGISAARLSNIVKQFQVVGGPKGFKGPGGNNPIS